MAECRPIPQTGVCLMNAVDNTFRAAGAGLPDDSPRTAHTEGNPVFVEIAFTFCLIAAPADCRIERQPFEGPLMACSLYGQVAAVEWLERHPKWRLTRYRCGIVDPQRVVSGI